VSSILLGLYLKHVEGRVVDVYKLERRSRSDTKSKHAQQYRVINISLLDGKK
jgi:ribosomal protein L21